MTVFKSSLAATLLLGCSLAGTAAFAQAPTGSITNQITAYTNAIWDVSLLWPDLTTNNWSGNSFALFASKSTNDALQVSLSIAYSLNGRGHLSGRGTNDLAVSSWALQALVTNQIPQYTTNLDTEIVTNAVEEYTTNLDGSIITNLVDELMTNVVQDVVQQYTTNFDAEVVTNQVEEYTTNLDGTIITNLVDEVMTNLVENPTPIFVDQVVTNWHWADVLDLPPALATYSTSGSVTGTKGNAIVKFINHAYGQIQLDGVDRRIFTTKAFYLLIPNNGGEMQGSVADVIGLSGTRAYYAGAPFFSFNPFSSYLGGGSWTLVLNFDPPTNRVPNRLTGNATVTLSSQAVYPFRLTGRYIPTRNQSQILLAGVNGDSTNTFDGRGASLSATLDANGQVLKMLGRICGQAVLQR